MPSGPVQGLWVAAIAWGAFAFGAVYSWALWPLVAVLLIVGLAGLNCGSVDSRRAELQWLSVTFIIFSVAVSLQLIPIPLALLGRLSPYALDVLGQLDLTIANGTAVHHAISIAPARTLTAAILFVTFSLVMFGGARLVSVRGPRGLAEALTVIGVLLALVGIIQKSLSNGKIYGFWTTWMASDPFGPFPNKNHFAGWMLMVLPLTLGAIGAGIARGMRGVKPAWRDRIIWLASPAGSRMILLASAAGVMALSLVLTMSRSGITAMALALAMTTVIAIRRQQTKVRKTVAAAYFALVLVAVSGWVGTNVLVTRFARTDWAEFSGRRGAWNDALAIAARFPVTGTGLNTYGVATLLYQQHDLVWHYQQAHNDYLHLLAEGGALLTIPAIACAGAFATLVRRRFHDEASGSSYWLRVGAVTGIAAVALQETVDFSLQIPANAALFSVLCAIAIHQAPPDDRRVRVRL